MDREEYPLIVGRGEMSTTCCVLDEDAAPTNDAAATTDEAPAVAAPRAALTVDAAPAPAVRPEQIIEAMLFSADTPLSLSRLSELSGLSPRDVRLAIADLNAKYLVAGLSFRIEEIARGYQMLTLPQFAPWVTKLNKAQAQSRLSAAALETLSIVAYKQPVIRADIEAIRGVSCGDVLTRLREMGLIRITGRAEIVGRPLLYGTTRKFLDVFGLADLEDLPPMESLTLRRAPAEPPAEAAVAPAFGAAPLPQPVPRETPVAAAGA